MCSSYNIYGNYIYKFQKFGKSEVKSVGVVTFFETQFTKVSLFERLDILLFITNDAKNPAVICW